MEYTTKLLTWVEKSIYGAYIENHTHSYSKLGSTLHASWPNPVSAYSLAEANWLRELTISAFGFRLTML